MSQFDVHRNLGRSRNEIPYVVIVQSASFDRLNRRIVVPLPLAGDMAPSRINPIFLIEDTKVILDTLDLVAVDLNRLGPLVGSLKTEGDHIVNALDEVFSRAWG
jgi:toxin CcdB